MRERLGDEIALDDRGAGTTGKLLLDDAARDLTADAVLAGDRAVDAKDGRPDQAVSPVTNDYLDTIGNQPSG